MPRQKRFQVADDRGNYQASPFSELERPLSATELEEMRSIEGFPQGEDAAIRAMSIPPYYTACPNPFISQFVAAWQDRKKSKSADGKEEPYHREPFAYDVSEGKQDPIYKIHSYHTKVPPRAIIRYILHYTKPGDFVLDAFCGSGMTGVAAQLCGAHDTSLRAEVEAEWKTSHRSKLEWGVRYAVLCDLSPVATSIAANYNLPIDVAEFEKTAIELIENSRQVTSYLFSADPTNHPLNYAVWSQIFTCPQCSSRLNFMELAFQAKGKEVKDSFTCPACGRELTKRDLDRYLESEYDPLRQSLHRQVVHELHLVSRGERRRGKLERATESDYALLKLSADHPLPSGIPFLRLPLERMYHGTRLGPKGIEYIHDLYFRRQLITLAEIWNRTAGIPRTRLRSGLRFLIDQAFLPASRLSRYPQLSPLGGVYYLPSMIAENEPLGLLESKLPRLVDFFASSITKPGQAVISTNSASQIPGLPDDSIDYVFTDPPFGENIFYADLNIVVEAWYGVFTAVDSEAIVDKPKHKGLREYEQMMYRAFLEYHRVLKPSHWITVVFHNSNNAVWNAIQEAMLEAGFIVADVRTLDKQQRSYRQVTSNAVKQDLIISAYKPLEILEKRLRTAVGDPGTAWDFVSEHLKYLPVFISHDGEIEIVRERQPHLLYDRMVATHVQRGLTIPVDFGDFLRGLYARYLERDGMFFLPEQAASYDRERVRASKIEQLALFVSDEKSALQWLHRELDANQGNGPQNYADIQPKFLRELHQVQYEALPELRKLLEDNFLCDDQGRWYTPDPDRQADLEALRQKSLLREFAEYRKGKGRLRVFRSEAVRAGFSQAWKDRDYNTILAVADRIPEQILQEDAALKMYYDNALNRAVRQPRQERLF
jgi:DNA modification methylase/transposase-like protein